MTFPCKLWALGRLDLRDTSNAGAEDLLRGPKRTALLVYLASRADGGLVRRDMVLPMFWPDLDQPRARHALRNTLHAIRAALGRDSIENRGREEIALAPGLLWYDVAAFNTAIDGEDLEEAVALYEGDFLEGFHVPGAGVEFERWVDSTRAALSRRFQRALEELAKHSEAQGRLDVAADCWRRLLERDPTSDRFLSGLVASLVEADDRESALRETRAFAGRVSDQGSRAGDRARELLLELEGGVRERPTPVEVPPARDTGPVPFPPVATPASPRRPSWARSTVVVGLGLVLGLVAVGVGLVSGLSQRSPPTAGGGGSVGPAPSLAVLPFENMSEDATYSYLSDGISEELIHSLGTVPRLRVPARTSAFAFRGTGLSLREIATELRVQHVLEGSVRVSGDSVRVAVRLVDTQSDELVMSRSWQRRLDDVLAIQDEIASDVLNGLRVTLLSTDRTVRATVPAAHRLYLQARHLFRSDREVHDVVEPLLLEAIELDPDYVPAHLGLARVYWRVAIRGRPEFSDSAKAIVRKAISIDPDNAVAHGWLGWFALFDEPDLSVAAGHFRRSYDLDPTQHENIAGLTELAVVTGHIDDAIALGEYQVTRDPACVRCFVYLADVYLAAQRLEEAEDRFRTAMTLGAGPELGVNFNLARIRLLQGRPEDALSEAEALPVGSPGRLILEAMAYHDLGRPDEVARALETLEEYPLLGTPVAWAWTGDLDRAFEELDGILGLQGRPAGRPYFVFSFDPMLRAMHSDPRWEQALTRAGVAPHQLSSFDFELDVARRLSESGWAPPF